MAAHYRYAYTRRKKGTARNGGLLVALLFIGCTIAIPTWLQHNLQAYILPALLVLTLFISSIVIGLFVWLRRKEHARLRALQLSDVDTMTGIAFEKYVAELIKILGYSVSMTKITGDFGGDLIGKRAGITTIVQVKRYKSMLGIEAIQQAVAAKAYYQASESMVITTSYFTKAAKELARVNNCVLVDREVLATWIQAFQRVE